LLQNTIDILQRLKPFSLQELESADLLERRDFKYVFNIKYLDKILTHIAPHYKVLVVKDNYYTDYHTNYYDTKNLKYYLQHHNGEANRFKLRTRRYAQSNICFFEVKFKNNKNWTSKDRYRINSLDDNLDSYFKAITNEELIKSLEVKYSRITLISNDNSEKITLDLNLTYTSAESTSIHNQICIAEIKSKTAHPYIFRLYLKTLGFRNMGLSKYCFGIASNYLHIKKNNFKNTINKIYKLIA
jgi:hypothetical protein